MPDDPLADDIGAVLAAAPLLAGVRHELVVVLTAMTGTAASVDGFLAGDDDVVTAVTAQLVPLLAGDAIGVHQALTAAGMTRAPTRVAASLLAAPRPSERPDGPAGWLIDCADAVLAQGWPALDRAA